MSGGQPLSLDDIRNLPPKPQRRRRGAEVPVPMASSAQSERRVNPSDDLRQRLMEAAAGSQQNANRPAHCRPGRPLSNFSEDRRGGAIAMSMELQDKLKKRQARFRDEGGGDGAARTVETQQKVRRLAPPRTSSAPPLHKPPGAGNPTAANVQG